jgi:hypothetical protein
MAKGEAMSKLDARFDSVWRELNRLQMDKVSSSSVTLVNSEYVVNTMGEIINTQRLLIGALVEAGILVEKNQDTKQYLELRGIQYSIRKVK